VRYAEAHLRGKFRTYHLVAVEDSPYLAATLERAQMDAEPAALAAALVADDPEIAIEEAEQFIDDLIAAQLLVSDLTLAVSGPESIHDLISQLSAQAHGIGALDLLEQSPLLSNSPASSK
jgi:hypothetical protein